MRAGYRHHAAVVVAAIATTIVGTARGQTCGSPTAGGCCTANETPACDVASCCNAICGFDPYCCETVWDEICVGEAIQDPACPCVSHPGCPGGGDCDQDNGTPGCDDTLCCNVICQLDAFCCDSSWDALCAEAANEICTLVGAGCAPACAKQNVECVGPGPQYDTRTAVGRLLFQGQPLCTAWIVAAPNVIMTASHCILGPASEFTIEFNYECNACDQGSVKSTETYPVTSLVWINPNLDYAILLTSGNPAANWGQATIDPAPPAVGTAIYEIHHAEGSVKGIDTGTINQVDLSSSELGCPGNNTAEMSVDVIASVGASGAPLFLAESNCVTGICHCGPPCAPGYAVSMEAIWPDAEPRIIGVGGTPDVCVELPCPWDIDGTGDVGTVDLLLLLSLWGGSPGGPPDFDGGGVSTMDLLILLSNWGPCP